MPQTHTHGDAPVIVRDRDEGSNIGLILGIIMIILVGIILLFYGIPFLAGSTRQSTPDVNIPDKVDVNLNR